MKNIHLLPTNKPSRLLYSGNNKNLLFSKEPISFRTFERSPQNIYITNDEEIKEGDRYVTNNGKIAKELYSIGRKGKIILTTDQDLIKDGVQAITNTFAEWFIKNPSCEFVEVIVLNSINVLVNNYKPYYKIIIPKEEPKQIKCYCGHTTTCDCGPLEETLEEAAENMWLDPIQNLTSKMSFIQGAKWQQERMGLMEIELRHTKTLLASCEKALEDRDKQAERMFSEEEVYELLLKHQSAYRSVVRNTSPLDWSFDIKQWFKQFKKK